MPNENLVQSTDVRVSLVTGAAQGLGRSIATALHARGDRVALADINRAKVEEAADSLAGSGDARAFAVDVRSRESIVQIVHAVRESFGAIDILVNNAGVTVRRDYWQISDEEWDEVLECNLRSVFITCQVIAPGMRERGWGRIVNISSLAGQQGGLVAGAHYAASKAGIIVLTKILARDLARSGVTVNAIAPAAIDTPAIGDASDAQKQDLAKSIPVGRLGRPEEVAALVAYLSSDDAGFVTGATLDMNGGVFMR